MVIPIASSVEADVDKCVAKAVAAVNDPKIVLDLQSMNGKAQSASFDVFWDELQSYLD